MTAPRTMAPLRAALLLLLGVLGAHAIYPDGHFDHVTKINDLAQLRSVVDEALGADQTLFAPAWNDATRAFAGNKDVRFADINLSEAPIRENFGPGAGGWPTIRYFNKETGPGGHPYTKKTDMAMCDELGPNYDYMMDYVMEKGGTSLCALDGAGCDERSLAYIEKFKTKSLEEQEVELERLEGMGSSSMKADLQDWIVKRKRLLKQMVAAHEEL